MSGYPASSIAVPSSPSQPPLSQVARVLDVFVAPSKTFNDILRSAAWWLPAILMVVFSLAATAVVQKQVGFDRVNENAIHQSPKREAALSQADPAQRAQQLALGTKMVQMISYSAPVLLLLGFAFYALILWACFNFLLGASTRYMQVYAVTFYAAMPYLLLNLLTMATLFLGNNPESYNYQNPVGTNPGYYLQDVAPVVRALLSRIDLIQLWTLALTIYGMAIIAGKKVMQSAVIVGGVWCVVTLLALTGALFS